jgi:hypothetical protein
LSCDARRALHAYDELPPRLGDADGPDESAAARLARTRGDPAVRAIAVRSGLLRWIYEQHHTGVRVPFSDSEYGWLATGQYQIESDRFTDREVRVAADYLVDKGLVEVVPGRRSGVRGLRITKAGSDCVVDHGGDISHYLKAQRRGGTSISIGTINSHGGAVGIGDHVNQSVGIEPAAMAGFVQALIGALPDLQLDPAQRAWAQASLEEVQREVERADPDPERATGAFRRFVQGLIDAGPQALTQLMLMFARGYIGPDS